MDQQTVNLEARQAAAAKLEAQVTRLSGSMEQLDKLAANLETRQESADSLETQVASLTKDLEAANGVIADLESRQTATEQLEARVAKITRELALLIDLSSGLESSGTTSLASRGTVTTPEDKATTPKAAKPSPRTGAAQVVAAPRTEKPAATTSDTANKQDKERTVQQLYEQSDEEHPWKINLISSPSQEEASSFSARAQSKGVNTRLQQVSVRGTPYWRVQITGFATYDEALAHSKSVKATLGLKETWIFKR